MAHDVGLLVLRLGLGGLLVLHGSQKLGLFRGNGVRAFAGGLEKMGIRPGHPFALIAALTQSTGGLLLIAGLLGPVGALLLAANLAVAVSVLFRNGFSMARGGYEYSLVLVVAFVGLSLTGPGPISLDRLLGLSVPEPWTWLVFAGGGAAGVAATVVARQLPRPQSDPAPVA